jgi:preprotein translocase subunit YajC
MGPVIVIVILLALGWLFLVLPARRRQRAHRAMQDDIEVGAEIITAGGIHAFVREAGAEELRIEIAPGLLVTLDRRAVAAVARDVERPKLEPRTADEGRPAPDEAPPGGEEPGAARKPAG